MANTSAKKTNALYEIIRNRVAIKHPDWSQKKIQLVAYNQFQRAIAKKATVTA